MATIMDKEGQIRQEHLQLTSSQTREPKIVNAEIAHIENLSPTIKGFTLQTLSKDESEATFKAGQWVDFFIPGLEKVGGYSMCSEPTRLQKLGQLDLAIKFSTWPPAYWLHTQAKIGSKVAFRVGGEFHYPNKTIEAALKNNDDSSHDILLVAGGVGINPLASIFFHISEIEKERQKKNQKSICRVNMLYSSKTKQELIFRDKIEAVVKSSKHSSCDSNNPKTPFNAKFFITRSSEVPTGHENGEMFRFKRIDTDDLRESIQYFSCDKSKKALPMFCFLCGPPEMIKEMSAMLIDDLGVPPTHVMYEMWW